MGDTPGRHNVSTARVLDAALVFMIAGACSVIIMQAVGGDWFPAEVSISQYGVGEDGWLLSATFILLAIASALVLWGAQRQGPTRHWPVVLPWTVWIIALVVMALVPTNEWPSPLTLRGQVHQAAAVIGLIAAPAGAILMVGFGAPTPANRVSNRVRMVVIGSGLLSWLFLALLVLTNMDIDVTGLGHQGAWSLHQTIAVVLDIVMIFALIICLRVRQTDRVSPDPSATAPTISRSLSR